MVKTNDIEKFELSEKQEEYLQIYHEYFVLKWNWADICRYHNCSNTKVSKAIHWVIKNRLNVPSKHLIKGALDAISVRLKKNNQMYDREITKKRYQDKQFIISLVKEMREDEKTIYRLQELYEGDEDEENTKLSAGQVLRLISEASK